MTEKISFLPYFFSSSSQLRSKITGINSLDVINFVSKLVVTTQSKNYIKV